MANYRVTTEVAPHRADWNVLYAAYADYYKVEQTQEMRDRTWGWIMEGRITCLMVLNDEGRPVGFAHLRELAERLGLRNDARIFGGMKKGQPGILWAPRKRFGSVGRKLKH